MTKYSDREWFILDQRWPKGRFVKRSEIEVGVHPIDKLVLYGDGFFEGVRVYDGTIFKWREHLERLYKSGYVLGINIPVTPFQLTKFTLKTCKINDPKGEGDVKYLRIVNSRGIGGSPETEHKDGMGIDPKKAKIPTLMIQATDVILYPEEAYEEGLLLALTETRKIPTHCLPSAAKTTNYENNILARKEAQEVGAHEAIMRDLEGRICEGSGDNIFLVFYNPVGNKTQYLVYTPDPNKLPLLDGITRKTLIDLFKKAKDEGEPIDVFETDKLTKEHLYKAKETIITGTAAQIISGKKAGEILEGKLYNGFDMEFVCPGEVFKKFEPRFKAETKKEENFLHMDASSEEIERYLAKGNYHMIQ